MRAVIRTASASRLPDGLDNVDVHESDDLFAETAAWCETVCDGIGRVVHLAWIASRALLTAPENLDCLEGTLALAKGAARAGVAKFLGIGTCFEYDLSGGVLSIETPLRPATPLLGLRLQHSRRCRNGCQLGGCFSGGAPVLSLRRAKPRAAWFPISGQLAAGERADLSSGRQIRDFLDVREAAAH